MGLISHELPTLNCSSHRTELTPDLTFTNIGVRLRRTTAYVYTMHVAFPFQQEFEIVMTKVNGSLGFTLRREDDSVLGHYVRSLVKEPAISDGRICPGDKIISVRKILSYHFVIELKWLLTTGKWNRHVFHDAFRGCCVSPPLSRHGYDSALS